MNEHNEQQQEQAPEGGCCQQDKAKTTELVPACPTEAERAANDREKGCGCG